MKRSLTALACLLLAGCFDYSDGDRIGTVIKLSKKGVFCKTWEGQMYLGGMKKKTDTHTDSNGQSFSTSSMVANTWDFTVEDERMVPVLMKAQETAEPIQVSYRQELVTFCRSDGDNYFITGVHYDGPTAPEVPGTLP